MELVSFRSDVTAYDFKPGSIVVVQHQDGTRCEFHSAFIEEGHTYRGTYRFKVLKVYTEHSGNHWFATDDLSYFYTTYLEGGRIKRKIQKLKRLYEYFLYLSWKKSLFKWLHDD